MLLVKWLPQSLGLSLPNILLVAIKWKWIEFVKCKIRGCDCLSGTFRNTLWSCGQRAYALNESLRMKFGDGDVLGLIANYCTGGFRSGLTYSIRRRSNCSNCLKQDYCSETAWKMEIRERKRILISLFGFRAADGDSDCRFGLELKREIERERGFVRPICCLTSSIAELKLGSRSSSLPLIWIVYWRPECVWTVWPGEYGVAIQKREKESSGALADKNTASTLLGIVASISTLCLSLKNLFTKTNVSLPIWTPQQERCSQQPPEASGPNEIVELATADLGRIRADSRSSSVRPKIVNKAD